MLKNFLIILFTFFLISCCYSQQGPEELSNYEVLIYNLSLKPVNFFIGEDESSLKSVTIEGKDEMIKNYREHCNVIFKIYTKNFKNPKKYTLSCGKCYGVLWNNRKKYWDLIEMQCRMGD